MGKEITSYATKMQIQHKKKHYIFSQRILRNPNMYFGGRNENHDYKEKFQEILWDPNIAMSK